MFVIVLENESYSSTFGSQSEDPYLAQTLAGQGALLSDFYAVGHESLDNYVAMISGQPPTTDTQGDCARFVDVAGPLGPGGIETGDGCVYPPDVQTIASQLTSAGFTWKAYMQDMGNVASRESAACGHPAIGSVDQTEVAVPGDGYATRHDPFMYFHSIIDDRQACDSHVVALGSPDGRCPHLRCRERPGSQRTSARSRPPRTSRSSPRTCARTATTSRASTSRAGQSAYADYDAFLQTWVPLITRSPAFKAERHAGRHVRRGGDRIRG